MSLETRFGIEGTDAYYEQGQHPRRQVLDPRILIINAIDDVSAIIDIIRQLK